MIVRAIKATVGLKGELMASIASEKQRRVLDIVVVAWFVLVAVGFLFAYRIFGLPLAWTLSVLLVLPLAVTARLYCRWPQVRRRELMLLALLFFVAAAGWALGVRAGYRNGANLSHSEDMRWRKFETIVRGDQAFRDVEINKPIRKNGYWVGGSVAGHEDLDRLRALAFQCGIEPRWIQESDRRDYGVTVRSPGG